MSDAPSTAAPESQPTPSSVLAAMPATETVAAAPVSISAEETHSVEASQPAATLPHPEEAPALWLRRGDQAFIGIFAICGLLLLAWQAVRIAGWNRPLIEIDRLPARQYEFRVDINRASWIEWAQLDGIGEILAKRIVEDRDERGPFRSIDEVGRVRGIGPKKLNQIRPWLEPSESEH